MITFINSSQPTFGKFSIVKIKKDAFKKQESLIIVEDAFEKEFNTALKKITGILAIIKDRFGTGKSIYTYFLEQPNYAFLMDKLKEFGGYSLEWLHMHTGIPIIKPMEEDYHSFIVLTKDELEISRLMNDSIDIFAREATNYRNFRKSRGEIYDELTQEACINHCMTSFFANLIQNDKPDVYKIDDLSGLKEIVKHIME